MHHFQRGHWWYRGRRFVVGALFRSYLAGDGAKAYLDVGCGTGEGSVIVNGAGVLTGVDMSGEALALAEGRGYASLHQASAEALPFEDGEFDGVLALDVLEHVADDAKMLAECSRVLRPGGVLILTVPAYRWLWSGHDEVFGHRRRYVRGALVAKIKAAGFDVRLASYYVTCLFPVIALWRLTEKVLRNKRASHFFSLPRAIDRLLFSTLALEGRLLTRGFRFPFGSSIVLVARKRGTGNGI